MNDDHPTLAFLAYEQMKNVRKDNILPILQDNINLAQLKVQNRIIFRFADDSYLIFHLDDKRLEVGMGLKEMKAKKREEMEERKKAAGGDIFETKVFNDYNTGPKPFKIEVTYKNGKYHSQKIIRD